MEELIATRRQEHGDDVCSLEGEMENKTKQKRGGRVAATRVQVALRNTSNDDTPITGKKEFNIRLTHLPNQCQSSLKTLLLSSCADQNLCHFFNSFLFFFYVFFS